MPTKTITAINVLNPILTGAIIKKILDRHRAPLAEMVTGAPTILDYTKFARDIERKVLERIKKRIGVVDGPPMPEHHTALIKHPKSGRPVIASRVKDNVDYFQVSGGPIPATKIKQHIPIELKGVFDETKN